ncbi:MAG TPA: GLUG motif-containing protein [Candidatus Hydrogenedentes bacterium]|nr:GLUG motif-containing protein [Candidatus Hydrogenedentota bacterium]
MTRANTAGCNRFGITGVLRVMTRFGIRGWWMMVMLAGLQMLAVAEESSAILIHTIEELQKIGNDPGFPLNGHYALAADIDASATSGWNGGAGFKPIGTDEDPFTGTFDGRGYVIRDLVVNRPKEEFAGLFGCVRGCRGEIRNVRLEGGAVTGASAGFLAGFNEGTIQHCSASGLVKGRQSVGGLVGVNFGSIRESSASGAAALMGRETDSTAGGLAGQNYGMIESCSATGAVRGGVGSDVGGLVGKNCDLTESFDGSGPGVIKNSWAAGPVCCGKEGNAGGLVGSCWQGWIRDCHASGSACLEGGYGNAGGLVGLLYDSILKTSRATGAVCVYGDEGCAGGLAGNFLFGFIKQCHASAAVRLSGSKGNAGGLTGLSDGDIENCYADGTVTVAGDNSNAGGLAGKNHGEIAYSHAVARVTVKGRGANSGGLVGEGEECPITACYWNAESTGQTVSTCGGTALNETQMRQQTSFEGWDFDGVWIIGKDMRYPRLRWEQEKREPERASENPPAGSP